MNASVSESQPQMESPPDLKQRAMDTFQTELDRAGQFVHDKSDSFQANVFVPAREQYTQAAFQWPAPTAFATVFLFLAFVPCLLFVGWSAAALVTITLIASFWFFVIAGSAAVVLLFALGGCLLVAATVTFWGSAAYLLFRSFVQIKDKPSMSLAAHGLVEDARGLIVTGDGSAVKNSNGRTTLQPSHDRTKSE